MHDGAKSGRRILLFVTQSTLSLEKPPPGGFFIDQQSIRLTRLFLCIRAAIQIRIYDDFAKVRFLHSLDSFDRYIQTIYRGLKAVHPVPLLQQVT